MSQQQRRELPPPVRHKTSNGLLTFHKGRSTLANRWYAHSTPSGYSYFIGPDDSDRSLWFLDVVDPNHQRVPEESHGGLPSMKLAATMAERFEGEARHRRFPAMPSRGAA